MHTKTIRQTATFDASPSDVYELLMDSKKHSKFSGAPAKISRAVGGKFTAYGGYIDGINLELAPNKKIVQQWRGSDWPAGHYSRATYSLTRSGKKTKLAFRQSGVPAKHYDSIKKGWIDYYWTPMKESLLKTTK